MFIEYFEGQYHYHGYERSKLKFKYGVFLTLWGDMSFNYPDTRVDEALWKILPWLHSTFGEYALNTKFELIIPQERSHIIIFFKDQSDQLAFKITWGEKPIPEWDEDNDCYMVTK